MSYYAGIIYNCRKWKTAYAGWDIDWIKEVLPTAVVFGWPKSSVIIEDTSQYLQINLF